MKANINIFIDALRVGFWVFQSYLDFSIKTRNTSKVFICHGFNTQEEWDWHDKEIEKLTTKFNKKWRTR